MRHFFSPISKLLSTLILLTACLPANSYNDLSLPDFTRHQNERSLSNNGYLLGQFWFRKISGSNGLIEYPPAYNYLRQAASEVLPQTGLNNKTLELALLNSRQTNAFVIPGNHLFLYSDILRIIPNEATLMGLLAHEIAHLELNHYERSIENRKNEQGKAIMMLLAGLAASASGDGEATSALWLGGMANQQENLLRYSRAHEHEADRRGRELLERSGLPITGMSELLGALSRQARGSNFPEYLSTHPLPQNRLSDTLNGQQNQSVLFQPSSDGFQYFRASVLAYRAALEDSQAKQLLQRNISDANEFYYAHALALVLNHYPEQAQAELDKVQDSNDFIDYLAVIIALSNNQVEQADAITKRRLALNPSDLTFRYLSGQVSQTGNYLRVNNDMLGYEQRMVYRHNIAIARQRGNDSYALYYHALLEFARGNERSAMHLIKRAERESSGEQQQEIHLKQQQLEQLMDAQKAESLE
ncbi:M48 family metallopeptidase [Marinomonas ostreistagni]|uniref:M48 family metallopeptidase n=1 Tax=Marinomonas ostreistagni TaxID=359209 RepID=UPI00194E8A29|nr:M48 family metalloprotease [Marinomonas ostreistagni]MBM6549975.1 M48 family metalloprotease [Marinomonas ostreistagni]